MPRRPRPSTNRPAVDASGVIINPRLKLAALKAARDHIDQAIATSSGSGRPSASESRRVGYEWPRSRLLRLCNAYVGFVLTRLDLWPRELFALVE